MCVTMLQISQNGTAKQNPRLGCDGYSYVKGRVTAEKVYWRYVEYSSDRCHSRLHTCVHTKTVVKPPREHICRFNGITNELRVSNEEVVNRTMKT